MKKQDRPTARERRLVQGVLSGQPVNHAARAAGYSPSSAASNSYVILNRPRVKSFLTEALERAGLTEDRLAAPLLDALGARVRIINPRTMDAIETDLPDHTARLAAVDRIAALYGCVPKRVELPDSPMPNLIVNISQHEKPTIVSEPADTPPQDGKLTVNFSLKKD